MEPDASTSPTSPDFPESLDTSSTLHPDEAQTIRLLPENEIEKSQHVLKFNGSGQTLFGIWIVNVFFTLITGGVFYFWAKARVRAYMWSQIGLDGQRFAFHGTGAELCIGWFKVMVYFGLPLFAIIYAVEWIWPKNWPLWIPSVLPWCITLLLAPLVKFWSYRYRLSRTSWRGIRFSFRGHAKEFLKIFYKGTALTLLSLGLYYPFYFAKLQRYFVSKSYWGTESFAFGGEGKEFFTIYFRAFQITLFAVGTIGLFYFLLPESSWVLTTAAMILIGPLVLYLFTVSEQQRFFWNHTSFLTIRFQTAIHIDNYLRLKLGNWALLLCTLGLAWPWVRVRTMHYLFEHISLCGSLDLTKITQHPHEGSPIGEEATGLFDIDADIA
jgi:uncharacterized membrane protein YjgN (DUF898 family)